MKKFFWWALFIGVILLVYWAIPSLSSTPSEETQLTTDEIRRAIAEGRITVVLPSDDQESEPEASGEPATSIDISGGQAGQWGDHEVYGDELRRRDLNVRVSDLEKELGLPGIGLFYTQGDLERRIHDLERKLDPGTGLIPSPFNTMDDLEHRLYDTEKDLYWWK